MQYGGLAPSQQLSKTRDYGIDEDAPFRAALSQIRGLLDTLGVEGAGKNDAGGDAKRRLVTSNVDTSEDAGADRAYEVGLEVGTDRLRVCPDGRTCVSSTRGERASASTPPFVYFDQKGDALGNLLELLDAADDASIFSARGNFFDGAGVYVLAELRDGGAVSDVEFQFLPGVLESVVQVRIVGRDGAPTTPARERKLLEVVGKAVGWLPLDDRLDSGRLPAAEKRIFEESAAELRYRERFEGDMEDSDRALKAEMAKERARIVALRNEITKLLDALARQEDARLGAAVELRSKADATRRAYEDGVNSRLGGIPNDGRYGVAGETIRLQNSFSGLINARDDNLAKIYEKANTEKSTEDVDAPPAPKPKRTLKDFAFPGAKKSPGGY